MLRLRPRSFILYVTRMVNNDGRDSEVENDSLWYGG